MATLIPSFNSCSARMESGERRLAHRLEDKLEDDYLLWYVAMDASKGLEFPVVFIPGLGYLPNQYGEPKEEARLFYVAMTRAVEYLILTGHRESKFVRKIQNCLAKVPTMALV
jgi:superfamily I DNA/RNA helicase